MNKGVWDKAHKEYYLEDLQSETYWMGRHIIKCPLDVWVVQEILWETRPDLIIETGTFHGVSALYYAQLMDLMGIPGNVLSIDITYDPEFDYPEHPKVEYLLGSSSVNPEVLEYVTEKVKGAGRVMVILDSDHACDHVLQELRAYHKYVSVGCYLIVEDTNVNGYPVMPLHGPGPMEAVKAWQPTNQGFEVDRSREKFMLSFHPGGWLRRVR